MLFSPFIQTALLACPFIPLALAATTYQLADSYDSQNFAEHWDFYNLPDPTNGHVNYVGSGPAQKLLLAGKSGIGHLMLDTKQGTNGRQAVRVSTKKSYNNHLLIADIVHAPVGTGPGRSCGLWPALWELGGPAEWPIAGEIDIYEGANAQLANQMTLHTNQGCQVTNSSQAFSGRMISTDCNVADGAASGNVGCAITAQGQAASASFGNGFNAVGGGVYATEVTSDSIKIWHFPRSAIPSDIASNSSSPDPSAWGLPAATFSGCDVQKHFVNLNIVINTAFCGDWAGKQWHTPSPDGQPSCAQLTKVDKCEDYVDANPDAFINAYWEFKSINVYTPGAADPGSGAAASSASSRSTRTLIKREDVSTTTSDDSTSTDAASDNCDDDADNDIGAKGNNSTGKGHKGSSPNGEDDKPFDPASMFGNATSSAASVGPMQIGDEAGRLVLVFAGILLTQATLYGLL